MPNQASQARDAHFIDTNFHEQLALCKTVEPVRILTLSFTSRRARARSSTAMRLVVALFENPRMGYSIGYLVFFAPHLNKWVEMRIMEKPHPAARGSDEEDGVRVLFMVRRFRYEYLPEGEFQTQGCWLRPWYPEMVAGRQGLGEISVVERVSTVGMRVRSVPNVDPNWSEVNHETVAPVDWEVEGVEFGAFLA
ncbi:hypothetical protein MMC20_005985 [Loxospora ochrophaea]|nr:hypothetical protein [Loxospora ochrophaea]